MKKKHTEGEYPIEILNEQLELIEHDIKFSEGEELKEACDRGKQIQYFLHRHNTYDELREDVKWVLEYTQKADEEGNLQAKLIIGTLMSALKKAEQ